MADKKKCGDCGQVKALESFKPRKDQLYGVTKTCCECLDARKMARGKEDWVYLNAGLMAQIYAAKNWAVFPLMPNRTKPATKRGVKDATTDSDQIKKWWQENPRYNIGIATGKPSGVIFFDIDENDLGKAGWKACIEEAGPFPDGLRQLKAHGGRQYMCAYDPALAVNRRALPPGVKVIGDGGFFVAEPSVVDGKRYAFDPDYSVLGELPPSLPQRWAEAFFYTPVQVKTAVSGEAFLKALDTPDPVNSPGHYRTGGIECIDAMVQVFGNEAVRTYARINAFKYIWRHQYKGKPEEDLAKAAWYTRFANGDDPRKESKQ
jgi:hypothetical protein